MPEIEQTAQVANINLGGCNAYSTRKTAKHTDVAKFLAEEGASVSVRNGDGKSPIDLAMESGQADLTAFLQQFSVA